MFKIGDRVIHSEHGDGTVYHIEDVGRQTTLVRFDDFDGWTGEEGAPTMPMGPYDPILHGMQGLWWCAPNDLSLVCEKNSYETDED